MNFENSKLWERTLADGLGDEKPRAVLRQALRNMRDRVVPLIKTIPLDCQGLTVHDETHLDGLWEMADLILGDEYPVTPVEAFVFGAAVLLHDAGLTLAAYSGGIDELKALPQWADAVSQITGKTAVDADLSADQRKEALFATLRMLHAQKAEQLLKQAWTHPSSQVQMTLLENTDLLHQYGASISRIAHSHHWPAQKLVSEFRSDVGACGEFPNSWTLDETLVALLLRCADAAHIDQRRAPAMLYALSQPFGYSRQHWNFQEKLHKPTCSNGILRYSSSRDFRIDEADDWWLCFDTLRMIDDELNQAARILGDSARAPFAALRVFGADNPSLLASVIRPDGWKPVDAKIRVSDPIHLAETLGGKNLYGSQPFPAIRELLQNAADAVRLRRAIEERPDNWGKIRLVIEEKGSGPHRDVWLHVDDQGVGMAERELTGQLLDFGRSSWRSSAIQEEYPGAVAKMGAPIGKFGIGFFSAFLMGDEVRVVSHRFDQGSASANVLEFSSIRSRPHLRKASKDETPLDFQTRVSIKLRDPAVRLFPRRSNEIPATGRIEDRPANVLRSVKYIRRLIASLDVDVEIADNISNVEYFHSHEWTQRSPVDFMENLWTAIPESLKEFSEAHAAIMSPVIDDNGRLWGRAAIRIVDPPNSSDALRSGFAAASLGGFTYPLTRSDTAFVGIMSGETDRASRNSARLNVPSDALIKWSTEQAQKIEREKYAIVDLMRAAHNIRLCGGNPGSLPFALLAGRFVSWGELQNYVSSAKEIIVPLVSSYDNALETRAVNSFSMTSQSYKMYPDVLVVDIENRRALKPQNDKSLVSYLDEEINFGEEGKPYAIQFIESIWNADARGVLGSQRLFQDDHYVKLRNEWVLRVFRSDS